MRRFLLRILVALLTFTVGLVISPIRFWSTYLGRGSVEDGGGVFLSYGFMSSYLIDLGWTSEGYPTPEKAGEVFEARLKGANVVLERTPKPDEMGGKVGNRAVVIFQNHEGNEQYVCVLRTQGKGLISICSSSLMHVLYFERHEEDYFIKVR
jgi:hypothetical protein